jgi:hypothetical protein
LISWAHFSAPVNQSFQFETNTAVVYGRFSTGPDFAFGNDLALRLRNDDTKRQYLIRLKDKDSVCGVAVEPGRYSLVGFVATFVDHRVVGQRKMPNSSSFDVRSYSVTYVGDFTGYSKIGSMTQEWGITSVTNNFIATTDEFRKQCPNFASVSAVSVFDQ